MVARQARGSTRTARPHLSPGERALAESTERYRSLFEYNPHAAFSLDVDGLFIDANPVAQQLSGYSLAELRTMVFTEVIVPEHVQRTLQSFRSAMTRQPQQLEASMYRRDGQRIEMSLTAVPVVVGDEVVGVHGIAEDVTERNEMRRELEHTRELAEGASATKSLFLANMSHEVRTPLTGLLGSVELLQETDLDPDQAALASLIERSSERLLRLVSDLLDFSRIEAGTLDLRDAAFSLRGLLDEVTSYVVPLAEHKGLTLTVEIEPDLPDQVSGDALRVSQVLTNLLENAVKFTETGTVALVVETAHAAPGTVEVRFRVVDTGIGIPAEQLTALFQAFTQVDPSTTRRYGGAGLGLAICQELVALMNGTLEAESTEGAGSTFEVTLPLEVVDPHPR
ncbi:MAG: sensor histidine kinase [Marmoricola sp.]|jgi:PAS domain S-box-containing protein|nr:sensor histidine kinase [Marmoricola sp.]